MSITVAQMREQLSDLQQQMADCAQQGLAEKAEDLKKQITGLKRTITNAEKAEKVAAGGESEEPVKTKAVPRADVRQSIEELEVRHGQHVGAGEYDLAHQVRVAINRLKDVPMPTRVRMLKPHGFISDVTGEHRFWEQGREISNAELIEMLTAICPEKLEDISPDPLPT